jgi:hypothetical protein
LPRVRNALPPPGGAEGRIVFCFQEKIPVEVGVIVAKEDKALHEKFPVIVKILPVSYL